VAESASAGRLPPEVAAPAQHPDKLVITTRAAEKYVSSVFDKLGIPSTRTDSRRVLAVLLYLRT
jgi:hypothetical protein